MSPFTRVDDFLIDLRWVSGARSVWCGTTICLAGSGCWDDIDMAYGDFMQKWMSARGAVRPDAP